MIKDKEYGNWFLRKGPAIVGLVREDVGLGWEDVGLVWEDILCLGME